MSSELVIVYHRQPYEEVEENGKIVLRENKSPNGIVPTLKSFFGSVNHVEQAFDRLRAEHPGQKHLALVASGINFVDLQGGSALAKEAQRRSADGGGLYLINVKQGLWEALERCGCMEPRRVRGG